MYYIKYSKHGVKCEISQSDYDKMSEKEKQIIKDTNKRIGATLKIY